MSDETLGWFWRFDGGPLDGKNIPTTQLTGLPPERIIAYPSPILAGEIGGLMPVPDTTTTREALARNGLREEEILMYTRVTHSEITDDQYAGMTHVVRGAEYRLDGTLAEEAS